MYAYFLLTYLVYILAAVWCDMWSFRRTLVILAGCCVMWYVKVPAYISHVEKRLNEETERMLHYLDQSTKWDQ